MAGNKNLNEAAKAKKDEFYTMIEDIEKECRYYKKIFRDKIILCNCDDPYESMFFQYFAMKFNSFGLKKLISSSYAGSLIVQRELSFEGTPNEIKNFDSKKNAYKANVTEFKDYNGDGCEDLEDVKYFLQHHNGAIQKLYGDENFSAGDFRSPECIEFLKEADIVVTNPPFSLFREYVQQLIDYNKKFLIIGNINCVTYKEIFPLIMQNKMWIGKSIHSGDRKFYVPDDYPLNAATCGIDKNGKKFIRVKGVRWFTNLDIKELHENILLFKSYYDEPEKYPKYDNYDAIEVSKTSDIPKDYFGIMGVPITFLDKYNPDQFEILDARDYALYDKQKNKNTYLIKDADGTINGKATYARILIRRKNNEN